MCLILFAYRQHPAYELVLLANRDEFYERPTEPAGFWNDGSGVLAGLDLRSGGTWMGITRAGRFAAVTNYRDPARNDPDAPSRGALVAKYLRGSDRPESYMVRLAMKKASYNGFNLLAGDSDHLCYFSNREGAVRRLEPGLYGLSNHLLDTPWHKVVSGKAALGEALASDELDMDGLFALLARAEQAPAGQLPDTGVAAEWERALSPLFIRTASYGTRSSTVLLIGKNRQVTFVEKSYDASEKEPETRAFSFEIEENPQQSEGG